MTLKQLRYGKLIQLNQQREQHLKDMQDVLEKCQLEQRSFTKEEQKTFDDLEEKISKIDAAFEKENVTIEDVQERLNDLEKRVHASNNPSKKVEKVEKRSILPTETRSYKKGELMGNGSNDVTIGDIIVGHTTGRYRTPQVRQLTTVNSGGVTISPEIFNSFIDLLRSRSFLNEFTVYNMNSKTLTIPKLVGPSFPYFKEEGAEAGTSSPMFEGVTLESKTLMGLTEVSLELLEQSAIDIGSAVNEIMLKAIMNVIQSAALYGGYYTTGPELSFGGILKDPNLPKVGTTISYATIGEGIKSVQAQNGEVTSLVINPTDWMNLQLLTDGAGGQFITPPSFLDDINIITTTAINEGEALVGNLSSVAMGISSINGVQLDISKDAGFSRGVIYVRTRFTGDVVLTDPTQLALIGTVVA